MSTIAAILKYFKGLHFATIRQFELYLVGGGIRGNMEIQYCSNNFSDIQNGFHGNHLDCF